MGIMPYLNSGSTRPRLKDQPSISTERAQAARKASTSGTLALSRITMMKAGNITNSPCAKLIVPEACHSSVKPSAASA